MIASSVFNSIRRYTFTAVLCLGISATGLQAQDASECEPGFRRFDHEVLVTDPVCIPEAPERITYLIYPSYLYPFGIKPVAGWGFERDASNFPVIADWILDGVQDVGLPPSLEALTATTPDLMILADTRVTEIMDELPLIAPTLVYAEGANWRDRHLFLGAVFNQEAEAEAQLAVVDQRIAELSEAITAKYGDVTTLTASLVRIFEAGNYFLANERYVSVELLKQIGFQLPEAVQTLDDTWGVSFTDESIQLANADFTILIGSTGGANNQSVAGDAMVAELMADPLWNTLDSFQNGQVFAAGDYFQQSSLLAAHQIVDEFTRIFDVEIATPNPFIPASTAEVTPEATEAGS